MNKPSNIYPDKATLAKSTIHTLASEPATPKETEEPWWIQILEAYENIKDLSKQESFKGRSTPASNAEVQVYLSGNAHLLPYERYVMAVRKAESYDFPMNNITRAMHRQSVEQAYEEGKIVPPEILREAGITPEQPASEPATASPPAAKEPWQMTREEWINRPLQNIPGKVATREQIAAAVHRTIKNNPTVPKYHTGKISAEAWARQHVHSDSFVFAQILIKDIDWYGPEGKVTEWKGISYSKGPIVIEANYNELGRYKGQYGTAPDVIVLDGQHRLQALREAGIETVEAWVGNKIAKRFGVKEVFQSPELEEGFRRSEFAGWKFGEAHYRSVKQALAEGNLTPEEAMAKGYSTEELGIEPTQANQRKGQAVIKEPWQMTREEFIREWESEDSIIPLVIRKTAEKQSEESMKKNQEYQALVEAHKNKTSRRGILALSPEWYEAAFMRKDEEIDIGREIIVKQALAEGKPVPPEALKDYPNLSNQA